MTRGVTPTILLDFLEILKSLKFDKMHVCSNTACTFNFVKFYEIPSNVEKFSRIAITYLGEVEFLILTFVPQNK